MSQISTSYIYSNNYKKIYNDNNQYFQNLVNYKINLLLNRLNSIYSYNFILDKFINDLTYDIKSIMNSLLKQFLNEHNIDLVKSYNYDNWLDNKVNKLHKLFEKLNKVINYLKLNLLAESEEEIYNYFYELSINERISFSKTLKELEKIIKLKKVNNFKNNINDKIAKLTSLLKNLENFPNIFSDINLSKSLILAIKKDFENNISKFIISDIDIKKYDIKGLENYILSLSYDFNLFYLDFSDFLNKINNYLTNFNNNDNLQESEIIRFFNNLLLNPSKYTFDNLLKVLNTISEKIYKQNIDNYFKKIIQSKDKVNKNSLENNQLNNIELKDKTHLKSKSTLKKSKFDKFYQKLNNNFIYLDKILGILEKLKKLESTEIFSSHKIINSEINNNVLQLKSEIINLEKKLINNLLKEKGINNLSEIKDLLYTLLQKYKDSENLQNLQNVENLQDLQDFKVLEFIINNDINLQLIYDNLNVSYLKLKKQINYFYYAKELNIIENNLVGIISDLSNLKSYRYKEILNKIKNFLNELSNFKNYRKIDENIYQDIEYRYYLILDEIEKIKQKEKEENEIFENIVKEIENQGYKFLITTEYGVVYLDTPLGFEYKIMLKFHEGKLSIKFIKIINDDYIINDSEKERDIEIVKDWCKNYEQILNLLKENNIFIHHEKLIEPTKENIDLIYIPVSKLPPEVKNLYINKIQTKKQSYQKTKKHLKADQI